MLRLLYWDLGSHAWSRLCQTGPSLLLAQPILRWAVANLGLHWWTKTRPSRCPESTWVQIPNVPEGWDVPQKGMWAIQETSWANPQNRWRLLICRWRTQQASDAACICLRVLQRGSQSLWRGSGKEELAMRALLVRTRETLDPIAELRISVLLPWLKPQH